MGHATAQSWNAEATDAKGYWVGTKGTVESLAGLDLIDNQREVSDDSGLDVPEFTLSGATDTGRKASRASEATLEQPLETWEVIDTQIPDDAFAEQPIEEKPRGRKANVLVSRHTVKKDVAKQPTPAPTRSRRKLTPVATPAPSARRTHRPQVVVSSPVDDGPMLTDEATPAEPLRRGPSLDDKKALAARMVAEAKARAAAAAAPSMEDRRALAARMAAEAKEGGVLRLADHRPPGTLPPMEELSAKQPLPEVRLPESSQESWGWDEADPLAVPQAPERPSLSVVQTAPGTDEDYDDVLASPMPAPPRPEMSLPWPLPAQRARTTEAEAMQVPFPVNAIDDTDLPPDPFEGYEPEESPMHTVLLVGGVLAGTAVFACAGMMMVAASTMVAVFASL